LIGSMTRFHPIGIAVGAALQGIAIANKDAIDGWLASVGILDKNLIPKTKEGAAALKEFGTEAEAMAARLKGADADVRQFGQTIAEAFDQSSQKARDLLVESFEKATDQQTVGRLERELAKLGKEFADAVAMGAEGGAATLQVIIARKEKELTETRERLKNEAQEEARKVQEAIAGGDETALLALIDRIRGQAQGTDQDLLKLATDLEKLTTAWQKASVAAEVDAQKRVDIVRRREETRKAMQEELADLDEQNAMRAKAAEEAAERAGKEADRRAADLGQAAGVPAALAGGEDAAQVANQLFADLRASGFSMAEAFEMSGRAVAQANAEVTLATQESAVETIGALRATVQALEVQRREAAAARQAAQRAVFGARVGLGDMVPRFNGGGFNP
jgi:hypothetical protein